MTYWHARYGLNDSEELLEECECGGCTDEAVTDLLCHQAMMDRIAKRLQRGAADHTSASSGLKGHSASLPA